MIPIFLWKPSPSQLLLCPRQRAITKDQEIVKKQDGVLANRTIYAMEDYQRFVRYGSNHFDRGLCALNVYHRISELDNVRP